MRSRLGFVCLLVITACCSCEGSDGLVSGSEDYARCKAQAAADHTFLTEAVEPLLPTKVAATASYEDACDSVFDSAYVSWDLPSANFASERFLAAGWKLTNSPEDDLGPGEVVLRRSVDGRDLYAFFGCDVSCYVDAGVER